MKTYHVLARNFHDGALKKLDEIKTMKRSEAVNVAMDKYFKSLDKDNYQLLVLSEPQFKKTLSDYFNIVL